MITFALAAIALATTANRGGEFSNLAPRIDYILVDPSVDVERYAVLAWHGEGGRPASDHFPIVADLKACRR